MIQTLEAHREARGEIPAPGLHSGVPHATYLSWPAASSSRLSELRRSPAHLQASLLHPRDSTAFVQGRATHTAVLEPHLFDEQYARAPEGDRRTKAVKEAWEKLTTERPGATLLKGADYDATLAMRDAVHAHPIAGELVHASNALIESSVLWTDEMSGVLCKARPDLIVGDVLVDLKTTTDAGPSEFPRDAGRYGYHRQGAFYLSGLAHVGILCRRFQIIAVEKTPPYDVVVYEVSPTHLEHGMQEIEALLPLYGRCVEEGHWPGYSNEIVDLEIPQWALAA